MGQRRRLAALSRLALVCVIPLALAGFGLLAAQRGTRPVAAQSGEEGWRHYTCGNCVSALALAPEAVWASTYGSGVVRWSASGVYRHFTEADGLPSDWVYDIGTSSTGEVWIGTTHGAAHYDGASWTTYQSASGGHWGNLRFVTDIEIGPRDQTWLVAQGKPYVFYDSEWTYYECDALEPGVGGINEMKIDEVGNRWFGSEGGLVWDEGISQRVWRRQHGMGADAVRAIGLEGEHPWVAVLPYLDDEGSAGVSHFDWLDWTTFTSDSGLTEAIAADVEVGPDGLVWLAHNAWPLAREIPPVEEEAPGASVYDGETWTPLFRVQGLPHCDLSSVVPDPAGGAWFAGVGGGIGNLSEDAWSYFLADDSPVGLWTSAVALHPTDGTVWSAHGTPHPGTSGGKAGVGLSWFDGARWQHIVPRDGYPGDGIVDMDFDRVGNLWLGTFADGALRYDGATWFRYKAAQGFVDGRVTAVARGADDDIWFGTQDEGVFRFDGTRWRQFSTADGLSTRHIEGLASDEQGRVFVGTARGLDFLNGRQVRPLPLPAGLPSFVTAVALDREGGLWAATRDESYRTRSVAYLEPQSWQWQVHTPTVGGKRIFSGYVLTIAAAPSGDVWFGDGGGAVRLRDGVWTRHVFRDDPNYSTLELALDIVAADSGEVWFGHGVGVSVYEGEPGPVDTPAATATASPTSTSGPMPSATPYGTPGSPDPGAVCVCSNVYRQVPPVVIADALANPERYYGWRYPLDPGKPPSPGNPLRECLSLRSNSSPFHPLFNSVLWRVGCP